MTDLKNIPNYVPGHGLLKGKRVVITAAAGTGIGFAAVSYTHLTLPTNREV